MSALRDRNKKQLKQECEWAGEQLFAYPCPADCSWTLPRPSPSRCISSPSTTEDKDDSLLTNKDQCLSLQREFLFPPSVEYKGGGDFMYSDVRFYVVSVRLWWTHPALLSRQQWEQRAAVHLSHQQFRHTVEKHNKDTATCENMKQVLFGEHGNIMEVSYQLLIW